MLNEIMSEMELEQVAGGNLGRTVADSKILYEYGLINAWHGKFTTTFCWSSYSSAVEKGWANVGITCKTNFTFPNEYSLNGKKITSNEAIEYLKSCYVKIRSAD